MSTLERFQDCEVGIYQLVNLNVPGVRDEVKTLIESGMVESRPLVGKVSVYALTQKGREHLDSLGLTAEAA